jgi:hypothetical protein
MSLLIAISFLLFLGVAQYVRWRRVARADGAFRCRIRLSAGRCQQWRRLPRRWSRRRLRARWVGDQLVVWRRPVLLTSVGFQGRVSRDGVYRLPTMEVAGLGYRPLVVELELGDGSRIELVTYEWARADLVGPYLSAALNDLPQAPRPRRQIRGPGS